MSVFILHLLVTHDSRPTASNSRLNSLLPVTATKNAALVEAQRARRPSASAICDGTHKLTNALIEPPNVGLPAAKTRRRLFARECDAPYRATHPPLRWSWAWSSRSGPIPDQAAQVAPKRTLLHPPRVGICRYDRYPTGKPIQASLSQAYLLAQEGNSFSHPLLPHRARPLHVDTGREWGHDAA